MNKVILTGYLAMDPELKTTQQGTNVTSFRLAVRRPKAKEDVTDFFTVVAWRHTAEFITRYFRKGDGIEICGTLTTRKWQDRDGNNRTSTEVVADEVDFGKKSKSENHSEEYAASYPSASQEYVEVDGDDDLPF